MIKSDNKYSSINVNKLFKQYCHLVGGIDVIAVFISDKLLVDSSYFFNAIPELRIYGC